VLGAGGVNFQGNYRVGLTVIGTRTVVRSGTFTGVQIWDETADQDGQVTDAAVATWAADVGNLLALTSGANTGASGWVASDLGGGDTCRFSPIWNNNTFGVVNPVVAGTYDVVTVTDISGQVICSGEGFIQFQDLKFSGGGGFGAFVVLSGQIFTVFCHVDGAGGEQINGSESFCSLLGTQITSTFFRVFSWCFVHALLVNGDDFQCEAGSRVELNDDSLWQGASGAVVRAGGYFQINGSDSYAVFDAPGASDNCLKVEAGGSAGVSGRGWGSGNNGATATGLRVDSGANVLYSGNATARFGFAGATLTEVNLAGDATVTYAVLGVAGSNGANAVRNSAVAPATFA